MNEIGMISSLCHPNLTRLYGCCVDTSQLFLVYEYMENKDLGHILFGKDFILCYTLYPVVLLPPIFRFSACQNII